MATVITAPEPFDFKQPAEPPVVFLAGSIDQGKAPRWDLEVIESLEDMSCVVLNPRRKDWDSSWKQDIENDKFREQVEWELKGLEQCSLIALCLTKDSKAPISLLEMGLHISDGRMIVFCPEGFYRKGNVDIVCARYGVSVLQDFEDFKMEVKRRLSEPVMRKPVTASDRMAWTNRGGFFGEPYWFKLRDWGTSSRPMKRQECVKCHKELRVGDKALKIPNQLKVMFCESCGKIMEEQAERYPLKASDRMAWRIIAKEFLRGIREESMKTAMNQAICSECGQKVKTKILPGREGRPSYDSHKDRDGEMCKGAGWKVPLHPDKEEWGEKGRKASTIREGDICVVNLRTVLGLFSPTAVGQVHQMRIIRDVVRQGDGKVQVEEVRGETAHVSAYDNPGSQLIGGVDVPVAALRVVGHIAARKVHLEPKGLEGIEKCSECGKPTRYWLKGNQVPLCPECAKKDGKKTAGMGDTHPFGSPLRRRRDYGERDGDADVDNKINNIEEQMPSEGIMTSSDNMRVRVITDRITAKAKEFIGAEQWDGEIQGQHIRFQWSDGRERHYRLTEMPVAGKKRLRIRSGGFVPWLGGSQKSEYRFLLMANVASHIKSSMSYEQVASEIDRRMKALISESNEQAEEPKSEKDLMSGPWETMVFYLEVEPADMKPFNVDGKDFTMEVRWDRFKAYSPDSDFQQSDPSYVMYESKSPTSARKLYKILKVNPDVLRQIAWGALGGWLKRNGIGYDTHFSQWH